MGKSIEASVTQWNTLFKFHPCPPETENYAGCAERYASYETTRTARDVRDPAGAEHLHRNSNPAMSQLQGHTLGTIGVQLAAQVAQGAADASREDVCSPALLPSPNPANCHLSQTSRPLQSPFPRSWPTAYLDVISSGKPLPALLTCSETSRISSPAAFIT